MPRRNKNQNRRDGVTSSGADPISRDHGRLTTNLVFNANGGAVFAIEPSQMGQRLFAMSELYVFYRFVKLIFTLYPNATSASYGVIMGTTDLLPTAVTGLQLPMESPYSILVPSLMSVPQKLIVPPVALRRTAQPWFFNEVGAGTGADAEIQATLVAFFNTGAAATVLVTIDYTVEFSSPVGTALIPRPINLHAESSQRLSRLEDNLTRIGKYLKLELTTANAVAQECGLLTPPQQPVVARVP
jgi:hypothetical protein